MYQIFILLTDVIEQMLISSIIFTLVPVKGSQTRKNTHYLFLSLLLLVMVRIANAFILFEGLSIYIVILLASVYMRLISNKKLPFIVLIIGLVFCAVFMNSGVTVNLICFFAGVDLIEYTQTPVLYALGVIGTKILLFAELFGCKKLLKRETLVFNSKKWSALIVVEYMVFSIMVIFYTQLLGGYSREMNVFGIVLTLILFFAELIVFIVLNREQKEKDRLQMNIEKMNFEQRYYAEALAQYKEMRRLRHDLKHFRELIGELASRNQNEDILHVLDAPEFAVLENHHMVVTGSSNLDYILNMKSALAEKRGIQIQYMIESMDLTFIEDSDLFVLIGNMLDNAIDHCAKEKNISFSIKEKKNAILLTVINSTDLPDTETTNALIPTSKSDALHHGYGLLSIKTIAEKYNGNFAYRVEKNQFKLVVSFVKSKNEELHQA